jgi:hypothetical protein
MRNKNGNTNKILGIITGIVILIALVALAMYFSTNRDVLTDITDNQEPQITALVTVTPEPTTAPLANSNNPPQETTSERFLNVYLDKNLSLVKDSTENICGSICNNKPVLLDNAQDPTNPKSVTLIQGKLTSAQVGELTMVWGLIPDKNLMIPPTQFAFGDGVGDIQVPAWDTVGIIAGVNANVSAPADEDSAVVYNFTSLVPIMKTAADGGRQIWVKLTPDKTKPEIYFLAKGTMSAVATGYELRVPADSLGTGSNALSIDNVDFVIL